MLQYWQLQRFSMTHDPFDSVTDNLISPARNAFVITPNDSTTLPNATKAVFVGSGGSLKVRLIDAAADVVFTNVPNGTVLAVRVVAVRASGTTATDLVGLA
jgi:hypothetical protein